jgi:Recombinase zinc beta ribbon domain
MVLNPVYRGQARAGRDKDGDPIVNESAHDPIVSPAEWRAAQPKPGKSKRTSETALLTGIVYCATCGRKMLPDTARSVGGQNVRIYRCKPGAYASGECPGRARIMAREIEPFVKAAYRSYFDGLQSRYLEHRPDEPDLVPLETAVRKAQANLEAWDDAFDRDSDPDAFRAGRAKRQAALAEAEDALEAERSKVSRPTFTYDFLDAWDKMSTPQQRRWLSPFFERIVVSPGREPVEERVVLEWHPDAV